MHNEKEPSSTGMTWTLAILIGLVVAGFQEDFAGFMIGAGIGALLAQVLHLRGVAKRHRELIEALREQKGAAPAQTSSVAAPAQTPVPAPRPAQPRQAPVFDRRAEPTSPVAPDPQRTQPSTPSQPATPLPPPQAARAGARVSPSAVDAGIDAFIRWFKGGNPLARIGIVILFFGGVFLAKYAADNSLFPIELRFIALALGAFALLIIGWRLKDSKPVYAQLLQGGGIAGLYLTVFAASRLFQLLPLGFALAVLIAIAVAAAIIAVAQNSMSLAVIGTAGGFLAPILVSSGSGNHVALFTYYAILNLGVFTVAWFRTWRALNVLSFLFTFSITGLWRAAGYESQDLFTAELFLILFFLQYVAVSILNCVRQPPNLKGYVSGTLVFGLPVVAFTLQATLVAKIEHALAWSALALGTFYLALAWTLWSSRRQSFRLLVEAFAALGVIFASLAIPLAFDTRTTAAMWAVEGAGLIWLGFRQQRKLARVFGALLQVAGGIGFLIGVSGSHGALPLLNSFYLGSLLLAVSGLLTAYWMHRHRDALASYEPPAELIFTLWALAWWLFAGLSEIDRFLGFAITGATLAFGAATAALLALIGMRTKWRLPQTLALYLPALTGIVVLLHAADTGGVDSGHPFAQWGESGWIVLFGVHYGLLYLHDRQRLEAAGIGVSLLHAGAYWTLALILAWETAWHVDAQAAGVWPSLPWGLAPALLLALVGRRVVRPHWPLAQFADTYRVLAAVPLAIAVAAWIVVMNLSSDGDPGWLAYVPLLNPLDVCVALALTSLALWWTSLGAARQSGLWSDARAPLALAAALIFLWLNAALIRALHYNFGAPLSLHGIANSTLVQASLSIFWGLLGFAAMTIAARKLWRPVWMVGAALMGVVILKLFVVDLSSIGTVARITSFLTVGVLLLVTGYLAPLPPRESREAA